LVLAFTANCLQFRVAFLGVRCGGAGVGKIAAKAPAKLIKRLGLPITVGGYVMATPTEALSFAQSLRVIGQDLDKYQPNSLVLEKIGDVYLVHIERPEPSGHLLGSGFLTR
jgi:hypothetical protein